MTASVSFSQKELPIVQEDATGPVHMHRFKAIFVHFEEDIPGLLSPAGKYGRDFRVSKLIHPGGGDTIDVSSLQKAIPGLLGYGR